MAFLVEPPGGQFQYIEGPRGPRGFQGNPGPEGPQGDPADPHTHVIDDVAGLVDALEAKADLIGGLVPTSQIPARALVSVYVVASQAAQLALDAQEGDVAVRSDLTKSYVRNAGSAGTIADWTVLDSPTGAVTSVNGQIGTVVLAASDLGAMAKSLIQQKGDLIVGTAADTPSRVGVSADRMVLTGRAAQASGVAWEYPTTPAMTVTANHTLVLANAAAAVLVDAVSDLTVTIPTNATAAFALGTVVFIGRWNTGAVTIAAAGGVTMRSRDNLVNIKTRYEAVSAQKVGTDEWWLVGALA